MYRENVKQQQAAYQAGSIKLAKKRSASNGVPYRQQRA